MISRKFHGLLDWILVVAAIPIPWLTGFHDQLVPTVYFLGLVLSGFSLNAITDYETGILKKLPFKIHRLVELTSPPAFILVPWLVFPAAGWMPVASTIFGSVIFLNGLLVRTESAS